MYAGRIVEDAPVDVLFRNPAHGYTAGLIRSLPGGGRMAQSRLPSTPDTGPRLNASKRACAFADRCTFAVGNCSSIRPERSEIAPYHFSP
jgi:peptide/nickel transport system ATP-binding protein